MNSYIVSEILIQHFTKSCGKKHNFNISAYVGAGGSISPSGNVGVNYEAIKASQ
jgi:hypothetical protein